MKTGIVRRIDVLGRIVLPKEIRKILKINDGDPIEIYAERDSVILKKYSQIENVERIKALTMALHDETGKIAIICDKNKVISVSGFNEEILLYKPLSKATEKIINENKTYIHNYEDSFVSSSLTDNDTLYVKSELILPVKKGGEIFGAIVLVDNTVGEKINENDLRLASLTAKILTEGF